MANPLVVVDVALLFAAFGVKLCYTQLFSSTPVSEGAKLAAYGEKLWECRKKAQKAWRQAKAAIAFAERLVRHGADPIEISRVNSKAVSFSEEAERANEKAFLFKKTIIKHIAYMKKKFGDLESTRRAVDESGVLVAMAESFRDEQENQSDELMRNMGIQNWSTNPPAGGPGNNRGGSGPPNSSGRRSKNSPAKGGINPGGRHNPAAGGLGGSVNAPARAGQGTDPGLRSRGPVPGEHNLGGGTAPGGAPDGGCKMENEGADAEGTKRMKDEQSSASVKAASVRDRSRGYSVAPGGHRPVPGPGQDGHVEEGMDDVD